MLRYEHDGTATVLADSYNGKRLNSPSDVVAHPDGSYWFTDPPYGGQLYEGEPDGAGGASNAPGKLNPRIARFLGWGRRLLSFVALIHSAGWRHGRVAARGKGAAGDEATHYRFPWLVNAFGQFVGDSRIVFESR